jgi:hypothetical protein
VRVLGDQITAWHKPSAGSWTLVGTRTDSTYGGVGHAGIQFRHVSPPNSAAVDDFGGGDVSYTSIFDEDTVPAGDILFARRDTNYVLEAGEVLQGFAVTSGLLLSNSFETAIADGTTITVANSDDGDAGDAFDQVGIGGAGTVVYDTARAAHGSRSAELTQDAANDIYFRWSTSQGTLTEVWGRLYIYRTAHPSNNLWLIRPQDAGTTACLAQWLAAGQLRLFDSNLGSSVTSSASFSLNTWMRLEWHLVCHPTAGLWEVKMFLGDDITPVETVTFSSADTITQVTEVQIGQTTTLAGGSAFWLDDLALSTNGYIGPAVLPVLVVDGVEYGL